MMLKMEVNIDLFYIPYNYSQNAAFKKEKTSRMPIGDYGIYNSKQASVLKTKSLVMSKTLQITTEKPTLEDNVLTSITNIHSIIPTV